MTPDVVIYTDGSCRGNPGPGGWGALLIFGEHQREIFGSEADSTNNRMELTAAIEALTALKRPCKVILHTDSQYVRNGITQWLGLWKARGWRTMSKGAVKNEDLWRALDTARLHHEVDWRWVKAHNGHPQNERADALARMGMEAAERQIVAGRGG